MMSSRTALLLPLSFTIAAATFSCTEDKPAPPKSDLNLKAILPDDVQMTQAAGGGTVVMSSPGAIVSSGPAPLTSPLPPADVPTARATAATPAPVAAAPSNPPVPKADVVVPPKDAKWTIFCTVVG